MKKFLLLILLVGIGSSCTFLRKVKPGKNSVEEMPQYYDGTYKNRINRYTNLWTLFSNRYKSDSTEIITIQTLDKNTLLISRSKNISIIESFLVKGSLKNDGFHFKRRRCISGVFPLLWSYTRTSFTLKKNKKGEIVLSEYKYGFVGFFIPIIGRDGTHNHILKSIYTQ